VHDDGVVVISLPHREFCPGDSLRPTTTLEHLLLDYALEETSSSLASREHFIAGCVGWAADWPEATKTSSHGESWKQPALTTSSITSTSSTMLLSRDW
jgi:hypothetical protein